MKITSETVDYLNHHRRRLYRAIGEGAQVVISTGRAGCCDGVPWVKQLFGGCDVDELIEIVRDELAHEPDRWCKVYIDKEEV